MKSRKHPSRNAQPPKSRKPDSKGVARKAASEPEPKAASKLPPVPRSAIEIKNAEPLVPTPEFLLQAKALGIEFEQGELDSLGRYLAMLLAANEEMNLTGITDPAEAWIKHILDSLTLLPALSELADGAKVIDVGTGPGLPGLPLAIVSPQLKFTLLDATSKKTDFIRQVARHLRLKNCEAVNGRAEVFAHDRGEKLPSGTRSGGFREKFDAVVARAVGPLATIAELTVPFAKLNGVVFLIKGQRAEEELAEGHEALELLKVVHVGNIDTPTGKIVALEKRVLTPKIYPRADGEPKRSPLGVGRKKPE